MRTYPEIFDQFRENLKRVENLVKIYDSHIARSGSGRRPARDTDVLRAGIVLLHATLEDFLRSIAIRATPLDDQELLNQIPLTGTGQKSANKFFLGALSNHTQRNVGDLLRQSIQEYHERWTSFNDIGQVKSIIQLIGVDPESLEFGDLPEMIKRRHRIVHHADSAEAVGGQGNHKIASLRRDTVELYLRSVRTLILGLEAQVIALDT